MTTDNATRQADIALMLADIPKCLERVQAARLGDAELELYPYRDHYLVAEVDLTDLAWCLMRWDSNTHRNDVIGFFELLDKKLREMQDGR